MMRLMLIGLLFAFMGGCSMKKFAIDAIGDALATGGDVYAEDTDPDLVREAIPFGLKTIEALLAETPEHRGLLLAAARGFTGYAYLLQQQADLIEESDLAAARQLRARASSLFLRGRGYGFRGLELDHPGFLDEVVRHPVAVLSGMTRDDADFLYWSGVGWAGALAADTSNLDLLADLPTAAALVEKVRQLDEFYNDGAPDEFFIAYEGGRPGGDLEVARQHYERALVLSGGKRASVYLALAESVAVPEQDVAEFRHLLAAALTVNVDEVLELRLVNTIARRRAQWLESHVGDLFLEPMLTE
jgi:predicted anti-sigma-YlaC factor YlaD